MAYVEGIIACARLLWREGSVNANHASLDVGLDFCGDGRVICDWVQRPAGGGVAIRKVVSEKCFAESDGGPVRWYMASRCRRTDCSLAG